MIKRPPHEDLKTLDYLHREAAVGKREDFEDFLRLVPDVPPHVGDELFFAT